MTVTYEAISSTTLVSAQASVTLNSFGGYTDLILVISARSSYSADNVDAVRMLINSDTGTNYSWTRMLGDGSATYSDRASNVNVMEIQQLATSSSSNTSPSVGISQFQNYTNTTTNKTILSRSGEARAYVFGYVSLWRSTSAITSLTLSTARAANFVSGSTFSLYGIKAE